MKRVFTILAAVVLTASAFAQAPKKMSYQAVIRNASNNLVTSASVAMQISILQGTANGTAVYVETQTPTTNTNGLVSIEIGGGTLVSGNFANIDWANGPYFVKTETDPDGATGGISYTITGTSQLMSVPYALYSATTESFTGRTLRINDNTGSNKVLWLRQDENNSHINNMGNFLQSGCANNGILTICGDGGLNFNYGHNGSSGTNAMTINTMGYVGIGVNTPARTLHINSVMRLEPIATAPTNPAKGDMYFDSTLNKLRVYDGTTWQNCW